MPKTIKLKPESKLKFNPVIRFSTVNIWDSEKMDFVNKIIFPEMNDEYFDATLEIPNGRNPNQNAWLTITITYKFNFVDSNNTNASTIITNKDTFDVLDHDGNQFSTLDWDAKSKKAFRERFKLTESFWNHKFLLITPMDYDKLDYVSMSDSGWYVRPNILCLFRLKEGERTRENGKKNFPARIFDVVRLKDKPNVNFRENSSLLTKNTSKTTFAHELGHALGMLHIKALRGGKSCTIAGHIGDDDCYRGYSKKDARNIMGGGDEITYVNATPWVSTIALLTKQPFTKWRVSMDTNILPRKIPLGVAQLAKPERF